MSVPAARFALASRRVVLGDEMRPAAVLIDDSRISGVVAPGDVPAAYPVDDVADLVIAPGVIDAHVHVNEPGRTNWEGFSTATLAAAGGGVTTLVDMPLNSSPVTTTAAALEEKRRAAGGKCRVNVGFYGGVIPGNREHIKPLLRAGVLGIKAFLCHSGLDDFPNATLDDLRQAAPTLAKLNRPLLVHAELIDTAQSPIQPITAYSAYLATRPPHWEFNAIESLIALCRASRCPVHIVHLANGDTLPMIAQAKTEGLPLTVETCPHYLTFAAEELGQADTRFKCAPPIREDRHRKLLWQGLRDGLIDTIGSDHSPCPPSMKALDTGDFVQAWGGISSLQLTLPLVWTAAALRGFSLPKIFRWLSSQPAQLVRLDSRKGQIAPGFDADLIVFDPDTNWTIRGEHLFHRHKITPYDGMAVRGQIVRTYVGGKLAFDSGKPAGDPLGQLVVA